MRDGCLGRQQISHLPSQKPPSPFPLPDLWGGSAVPVEPSTDRPGSEGGPCLIYLRSGATCTVGAQGRPVVQHGRAAGRWSPWESSGSPQRPGKVLGSLLTLQPNSHVHAARAAREPQPPAQGCFGGPSSRTAWPTGPVAPWPVNPCLFWGPPRVSSLWPPRAATCRGRPTRSRAACSAVGRTESPKNAAS